MKKIVMFLMIFGVLYPASAQLYIVLADLTIDTVFLKQDNEQLYTDMLYDNLYAQIGTQGYTYLPAHAIGKNRLENWQIRNEIDAYVVMDTLNLNYLIYGKIEAAVDAFEANFKIYSKKDDQVIDEIVCKIQTADKEFFIKEVAFKINAAIQVLFNQEINFKNNKPKENIDTYNRNVELMSLFPNFRFLEDLGYHFSIGYTIPFANWNHLFFNVIDFKTAISLVKLPYLHTNDLLKIGIRPGFAFSYTLAKNQPELAVAYMHTFAFRFPVEFLFIFSDKYIVTTSLDLHMRIDSFYQNLYDVRENNFTATAFGWAVGLGFEYPLDTEGLFTIGLNNLFDFAVYDEFYCDYKIVSYLLVKMKETKKQEKNLMNDLPIKF